MSLFPYPVDENGTYTVPCNESQYLSMEEDPMFNNFYISRNISTAHVPTNVYDLCKWSYNASEIFPTINNAGMHTFVLL